MSTDANREAYYRRISQRNLAPLWEVLSGLVTPEPVTRCQPVCWAYDSIRADILESGELITAKEAERRVLILENPGMPGESKVTESLYAGMQLILPGEVAPAHRHTQAALRFVIEGSGAYTSVDGEKTIMEPGDFVITPSWCWHDHGNDSSDPMVWMDGLDIPMSQFFGTSFLQHLGEDSQAVNRPVGDSMARFGNGLLPVDHAPGGTTSPVFNYPYARTRESLAKLATAQDWDACHGVKLRYVNPVTGGAAIATMGTFMQLLPADFNSLVYRCSASTVYSVVEGTAKVTAGDKTFRVGPRDTFVVPTWNDFTIDNDAEDLVLFSFSDRPVQESLGLWREQRGERQSG